MSEIDISKPVMTRDGRKVTGLVDRGDVFAHPLRGIIEGEAHHRSWGRSGSGWASLLACQSDLVNVPEPAQEANGQGPHAEWSKCHCSNWAHELLVAGHHVNCEMFDRTGFVKAVYALIAGMEAWAADEDGVHSDAWKSYVEGCRLIGKEVKTTDDQGDRPAACDAPAASEGERDGLAKRLRDACVGHPHAKIPWPHRLLHEAADALDGQGFTEKFMHLKVHEAYAAWQRANENDVSKLIDDILFRIRLSFKPEPPSALEDISRTLQSQLADAQRERDEARAGLEEAKEAACDLADFVAEWQDNWEGVRDEALHGDADNDTINWCLKFLDEIPPDGTHEKIGAAKATLSAQLAALNTECEQKDAEIERLKEQTKLLRGDRDVFREVLEAVSLGHVNSATAAQLRADWVEKNARIAKLAEECAALRAYKDAWEKLRAFVSQGAGFPWPANEIARPVVIRKMDSLIAPPSVDAAVEEKPKRRALVDLAGKAGSP